MNKDTADALIDRVFEFTTQVVCFTFQGGEPLLAGLDFYKYFVERAESLKGSRKLYWSLQTNGTLIDEEFASFFKKCNFLIGISLDGPEYFHDAHRGAGSFKKVMAGINCLKSYGVAFNVLCVVTDKNAGHAGEIYRFFTQNGFYIQQYIPCLEPIERSDELRDANFANGAQGSASLGAKEPEKSGSFLSPELLGNFLCKLYDCWIEDLKNGKEVSIRYFDNLASVLSGQEPESCTLCGHCRLQLTVEADGSVYPCDFYALDEYRLGNIRTDSLVQIVSQKPAENFIACTIDAKCLQCQYYKLCKGGCRRERQDGSQRTVFCDSYFKLFEHMKSLAK